MLDYSEVRVEGLETLDYLDNLCQRERFTEQGDTLTFESEVIERCYVSYAVYLPGIFPVLKHEKPGLDYELVRNGETKHSHGFLICRWTEFISVLQMLLFLITKESAHS